MTFKQVERRGQVVLFHNGDPMWDYFKGDFNKGPFCIYLQPDDDEPLFASNEHDVEVGGPIFELILQGPEGHYRVLGSEALYKVAEKERDFDRRFEGFELTVHC
jgi:hypothetical protein